MPADPIPLLLVVLSVLGFGLLLTTAGIYWRLGQLTASLSDLKSLAVGSQAELAQAAESINQVHGDLTRLVANSTKGVEIVRSVTGLPTR